jgi:uncharacterized metal-binding protein YceD (DUF177 family)
VSLTFSPALVTEEHPHEIREQIPPDVLALNDTTARATEPIEVELTIQKDEENFLVTGWARTTLLLRCARDGEMFPQGVRAKVEHVLEGPHAASVDLTEHIREDILLEIPLNASCQLKEGNRCPVTNEVYTPRAENPAGTLAGEEIWAALSKIKPKK